MITSHLAACKGQINSNNNAFVEVLDGTTSLGRAPIGTVPYAVESDHAVNATSAVTAATANAAGGALAAAISTIQSQVHPSSAFHAWLTQTAAIANDGSVALAFDHVEYDLGGEYVSATGVFTPTQAGYYLVMCTVQFAAVNFPTAIYEVEVHNNGFEVATVNVSAAGGSSAPEVTTMLHLAAGDSVTCLAWQNTGATQVAYTNGLRRTSFGAARLY